MKTPLQQLTTLIQASNPELMTLGVGCEFLHNNEKWLVISCFNELNQTKRERYIAETVDYDESVGYAMKNFVKGSSYEKKIEIIGKPPTLVDVLKWLKIKFKNINLFISYRFQLLELWNLNSIYLRDQSTELINFLINL